MPTATRIAARIFREYDIRGVAGVDLTDEAAYAIGRAYATYLDEVGGSGPIAVGRDNRPNGTSLQANLVRGLTDGGIDVVDVGVVPTPLLYWAVHNLAVGGGIQVTGSHNPAEYNGFKLGIGTRSIWGPQIQRLRAIVDDGRWLEGQGRVRSEPIVDRYLDDIVARTGPLARPLSVVVDCGNGAGALVAPELMRRLGVRSHCLFCESDGTFPNHHPDPTVPENLRELIAEVVRRGADVGVAYDGDADRIGVISDIGEIIWGDQLLILYARDVLRRTGAGQSIIFDVKCSQTLPEQITLAGGTPVMCRTGHSLIEEKMHQLHAPVAGEMSGHMFFSEGFYGFDDALYGSARLLRILAESDRSISQMLADVPRFESTPEIRVDCADEIKFDLVARAIEHFRATHDVIDVDGARVLFGDGWGLIRASNTQPILVMRFEARTSERLNAIRDEMEGWLREQGVQV